MCQDLGKPRPAVPLKSTCLKHAAALAKTTEAPMPASVPSKLTAPSVPRFTGLKGGVDMYVVLPYALPTSDAVVSLSLLQKLATKPRRHSSCATGAVPLSANSAHTKPATPLPHTLPTPRRPPRASAMPSRCFCSSLNFVTALPKTKYKHTKTYPPNPNAAHAAVPKNHAFKTPGHVKPFSNVLMPATKTRVLAHAAGNRPGLGSAKNPTASANPKARDAVQTLRDRRPFLSDRPSRRRVQREERVAIEEAPKPRAPVAVPAWCAERAREEGPDTRRDDDARGGHTGARGHAATVNVDMCVRERSAESSGRDDNEATKTCRFERFIQKIPEKLKGVERRLFKGVVAKSIKLKGEGIEASPLYV